jgi:hypothetical protein
MVGKTGSALEQALVKSLHHLTRKATTGATVFLGRMDNEDEMNKFFFKK